jgi:hypothetical protein
MSPTPTKEPRTTATLPRPGLDLPTGGSSDSWRPRTAVVFGARQFIGRWRVTDLLHRVTTAVVEARRQRADIRSQAESTRPTR